MARKRFASSVHGRRAAKSAKHMANNRIDFSDIPGSTEAELKRARRVAGRKLVMLNRSSQSASLRGCWLNSDVSLPNSPSPIKP